MWTIFGVLWRVGPGDVMALDRHEGVSEGRYDGRIVHVTPTGHDPEPVIVYVDPRTEPGLPRQSDLEKVIRGAHTFGLPSNYLSHLSAFAPLSPVGRARFICRWWTSASVR